MEENRKKHGWTWAAILLVMLLVAYPLSFGPVVALIGATGTERDPFWFPVSQWTYGPLALLPKPLRDLMQW